MNDLLRFLLLLRVGSREREARTVNDLLRFLLLLHTGS